MENWTSLFGAPKDCECQDCSSIFSPAAYHVDILQFLDNCPKNAAGLSPLDVLIGVPRNSSDTRAAVPGRRPDIGNLLLTCENTNTRIRTIDLVNEIMEYYVANYHGNLPAPAFPPDNDLLHDTGEATAEELSAEPQYTRIDAYRSLYLSSVYPFNLPYHQPLDIIRTYLGFLASSRAELLETYKYSIDPVTSALTLIPQDALDAENLGLSLREYEILTKVDFSGTALPVISAEIYFGSPAPAYTGTGIPVEDLLLRTGLQYTELLEILKTKLINPGQDALNSLQRLLVQVSPVLTGQALYTELKSGSWNTDIPFKNVLTANGVDLAAFPAWLATNFPLFQQVITLYEADSTCDIGKTTLHSVQWVYEPAAVDPFINDRFLSRLHRLIRLWRKTGWSVHELDTLIAALGEIDITQRLIHKLSLVKKINAVLQLPLAELACLWGNIDTYGDNSLYAQLFLKNTGKILSGGTTEQSIFFPGALNDILSPVTKLLKNYLPEIFAALGISAADYNRIVADSGIDPVNGKISVANLSILYRYKLLADTLSFSVDEFCTLKSDCIQVDPFADIDKAWDFLQQVEKFKTVQGTGFSVPVLSYVLHGKAKDVEGIALTEEQVLQLLPKLRDGLLNIQDSTLDAASKASALQALVISSLSSLLKLDIPSVTSLVAPDILGSIPDLLETGLTASYFKKPDFTVPGLSQTEPQIDYVWLTNPPNASVGALNFSVRWTGWICPPADGEYTFTLDITEADESAGLWIGDTRLLSLNRAEFADTITAITGQESIALKGGLLYPIRVEYVEVSGNAGIQLSWQSALLAKAFIDSRYFFPEAKIKAGFLPKTFRYHQAALLVKGFALSASELSYFVTHAADFNLISFLPIDISHWFRLFDYVSLRKIIPAKLLLAIFQMASGEEQAKLGTLPSDALVSAIISGCISGWDKDFFSYLSGNLNLSPAAPTKSFYAYTAASFSNEMAFLQIKKAIELAIKTKMPVSDSGLPAWTAVETDPVVHGVTEFDLLHTIATQIKNAVKAKNTEHWLTIARQLNDLVRENQKQALISYLLTLNLTLPLPPGGVPVTTADMLYEYLCIDVSVSTAVDTSRLIQHTLAVQIFADRCLLGLEKDVPVKSINPEEWDWMKHYAVAAGLKKLFVFVENYLDPSLRDDKSPFFKDFESALKKNDITDENVENAFRAYLYQLNEVSNLELCGMYADPSTQTIDVFGRTHSAPYAYFHRTAINKGPVQNFWNWTAWELVELDIKSVEDGPNSGVHLIPVIWKQRLFLFWPVFTQKSIARKAGSASFYTMANSQAPDASGPQKFWEIRLAWSEYAQGKWTPKKLSKETMSPLYFTDAEKDNIALLLIDPKSFFWNTSFIDNDSLKIALFLRSTLLQSTFHYDQVQIGCFILSDIHDPIVVSYDTSSAISTQKVQFTFPAFDYINSENWVENNVALYLYYSDQPGGQPRNMIWCWNNGGSKTDQNNNIPLTDLSGNPSVVTIPVAPGSCMFTLEAYTRDDSPWPSASDNENNLTTSNNSIFINFADPLPTGIQKIGPSGDDQGNEGVALYFTLAPAGSDLSSGLDWIQTISTLGDIYSGEPSNAYRPDFETFFDYDELILAGDAILQNTINHQVLFSNDLSIHGFENRIGNPFFYIDDDNHKSFFVTPFNPYQIFTNLTFAEQAPLAMVEHYDLPETKKWRGFQPPEELLVQSVKPQAPVEFSTRARVAAVNADPPPVGAWQPSVKDKRYNQEVSYGAPPFYKGFNQVPDSVNGNIGFYTFFHPYVSVLIKKLNQSGVSGMLQADTAEFPADYYYPNIDSPAGIPLPANDQGSRFTVNYAPDFTFVKKYDPGDPYRNYYLENVDFSEYGTYACYNWELFFHAPYLVAIELSKNGKYAEARKWFHYIFNPQSIEAPTANENSPFWQVLPFKTAAPDDIADYISKLSKGYGNDTNIDNWRADPFNAFLIARGRPIAFMKNVVMRYLDNLINWADDLFVSYTRENINEATLLYVLAARILGPAPQYIPRRGTTQGKTYNDLSSSLDDFGDALVQLENSFPNSSSVQVIDSTVPQNLLGIGHALYFCIPPNAAMLQYWTKVGDRLFKIRHGQNIDGLVVPLALYEPPIDPELLLLAHAQGLDIAGILAELESPAPLYRYNYLLQKAGDFCSELVALGNALLAANEKHDTEQLARLRQTQEIDLLNQVTEVRTRAVLEAQANLDSLTASRNTALKRLSYYSETLLGNPPAQVPDPKELPDSLHEDSSLPEETIIATVTSSIDVSLAGTSESGVKVIPKENLEMKLSEAAQYTQLIGNAAETLAGIFHLLPDFHIMTQPFGIGTDEKITGGQQLGDSFSAGARAVLGAGSFLSAQAASASRMAGFIRREQEWVFQANMTQREIVQLDKQITAAQIRLQMASHELDNHRLQIEHAQDVDAFYRAKFSNEELYSWMTDSLQKTYKQAYKVAYDMAKKAEKAYRLELGIPDSNFIQYGYYNNNYQGVLAGEQLQLALKQMDASYVENNVREYELTRHISILQIEPLALIKLKEKQLCQFTLPEELFDMDYTGHYYRRIKSISITLPCIAGPYTTINATLRLLDNTIRISTDTAMGYAHNPAGGSVADNARFTKNTIPFTSIATSTAQNDSGLFELIFRDERYLPFEGAGIVRSLWQFELSSAIQQFDYNTISDIVLHIKYTAREGDQVFKAAAETNIKDRINAMMVSAGDKGLMRHFSSRHDFANEWYQFLHPVAGQDQVLSLDMPLERFPFFAQKISGKKLSVISVELFGQTPAPFGPLNGLSLLGPSNIAKVLPPITTGPDYGNLLHTLVDYSAAPELTGTWQLKNPAANPVLTTDDIQNVLIVIHYKLV